MEQDTSTQPTAEVIVLSEWRASKQQEHEDDSLDDMLNGMDEEL